MKIPIFNGKIHYKWPFSIAMFVYQRVVEVNSESGQLLPFAEVNYLVANDPRIVSYPTNPIGYIRGFVK